VRKIQSAYYGKGQESFAMKKILFFVYILLSGILMSCAGHRPMAASGTSRPKERASPAEAPEAPPERADSLEQAILRVKRNSQDIKKYFVLDAEDPIVVKADLAGIRYDTEETETFEVVYDLKRLHPQRFGFEVPFMVKALGTGVMRHDTLHWNLHDDEAGILLAFDDDHHEVWERNLGLFDRYGAKVTFFVQGAYLPFCISALNRGHDVGYHTLNHLNLPKVSRDVFFEETLGPVDAFRAEGVPLTSFAYPFGLSEPWMHEELLKSFTILRGYGVTFRVYDSHAIRKGYISSKAIDNILFKQDADFEEVITLMLRTVKFIGGDTILPLTTHTISDTADWGIKPHRLEYLLQAAGDLRLRFYRYKDFTSSG
jgi:peptidoglycan/xylan/chitin deacetylase (PgdA/CDA1 family)